MMDSPDLVVQLHREYIDVGAQVITLNSYPVTPERLERDAEIALFEPLQNAALDAAIAARENSGKSIKIAGCLPPLVASYHFDIVPDDEKCLSSYRRIVELQARGVDLFLGETLSTVRECEVVCRAASESGKPVWISFTVDDTDGTLLRSGELLQDGIDVAIAGGAEAILVNCSIPEAVKQSMALLSTANVSFGGFANGFTSINGLAPGGTVDTLGVRDDLGPLDYADHAMGWVGQGATLIGGCCEVGPSHIDEIRKRVNEVK